MSEYNPIYAEDEDGERTETVVGHFTNADPVMAQMVIEAKVGDDGRSEWFWIRLADNSLVLACYPRGDTYFETEADVGRP